jgi:hypothetical protein
MFRFTNYSSTRSLSAVIAVSGVLSLALETRSLAASENSAATSVQSPQQSFVNRSLVTVGGDVYTSLDARLLLGLWNALTDKPVPMVTDFEQTSGRQNPPAKTEAEASSSNRISQLAPDSKRLLYILSVWDESRRLGLFAPSEKAFKDSAAALQLSSFLISAPVDVRNYWSDLGPQGQRIYYDMILRARAYLKVRGDIDANLRLADTFWFWHGITRE